MVEIKSCKTHLMRPITIQRRAFSMRLKAHATWIHLERSIAIQWPSENHKNWDRFRPSDLMISRPTTFNDPCAALCFVDKEEI